MIKSVAIFVSSAVTLAIAAPVLAQTAAAGVPSPGDAASKLVGASVYTVQGENVGSIVRVVSSNHAGESSAVLSLNQNVERGTRLVAVPLNDIKIGPAKADPGGAGKATAASASANDFNWLAGGGG